MGKKIEIDLPDPEPIPDLSVHPAVSDLRERLARLEERISATGVDPATAEALSVANQAARDVAELRSQLDRATDLPAAPVVEVHPQPELPKPEPDPEQPAPVQPETPQGESLPIFHPSRWL